MRIDSWKLRTQILPIIYLNRDVTKNGLSYEFLIDTGKLAMDIIINLKRYEILIHIYLQDYNFPFSNLKQAIIILHHVLSAYIVGCLVLSG